MKIWRGQPEYDYWRKPFTARERALVWWGLSACFACIAVMDWLYPKQPPFSGKLNWLYSLAYASFGSEGIVCLMLVVAAMLLVVGFLAWRTQKTIPDAQTYMNQQEEQ